MRKYLHLLDMRAEDFDQELLLQTLKGETAFITWLKKTFLRLQEFFEHSFVLQVLMTKVPSLQAT